MVLGCSGWTFSESLAIFSSVQGSVIRAWSEINSTGLQDWISPVAWGDEAPRRWNRSPTSASPGFPEPLLLRCWRERLNTFKSLVMGGCSPTQNYRVYFSVQTFYFLLAKATPQLEHCHILWELWFHCLFYCCISLFVARLAYLLWVALSWIDITSIVIWSIQLYCDTVAIGRVKIPASCILRDCCSLLTYMKGSPGVGQGLVKLDGAQVHLVVVEIPDIGGESKVQQNWNLITILAVILTLGHIVWWKCCWWWRRTCWWENPVWSTVVQYFCRLLHGVVEIAAELHSLDVQRRHDHLTEISIFIDFIESPARNINI